MAYIVIQVMYFYFNWYIVDEQSWLTGGLEATGIDI